MTRIIKIKTSEEYANLVPPLSAEEYESLKESIRTNRRLWVPIIVNNDWEILDGHHRFKACNELGIKESEIKTTTMSFTDKLQEQMFVIDCNLQRRHLNNFQRTELALKSKSFLNQIAKQNESIGGSGSGKGKGDRILSPLGRVDEQIGRLAGVSRDTVQKVQKIMENGSEWTLEGVRTGRMSINEAIKQMRTSYRSRGTERTELTKMGDIRDGCRILWKALTDKEFMPHKDEDLIVDHIKPTREYRRFIYGLAEDNQNGLHDWLSYTAIAIKDMLQMIEETDNRKE